MDQDLKDHLTETTLGSFIFGKTDDESNVKRGAAKYGMTILLVILVALVVYKGKGWLEASERAEIELQQTAMWNATSPIGYDAVVEKFKGKPVASFARQYAADLLLSTAISAKVEAKPTSEAKATSDAKPKGEAKAKDSLENAVKLYQQVIAEKGLHPARLYSAKIGLAIAYTGLSDLGGDAEKFIGDAKAQYTAVAEAAKADYPHFALEAEKRLATLARLKEDVDFAPEDVKKEEIKTDGKTGEVQPAVDAKKTDAVAPVLKPTVKPAVKPTIKPAVEPAVKPVVKPVVKPEVKSDVKPVDKPEVLPPALIEIKKGAGATSDKQ